MSQSPLVTLAAGMIGATIGLLAPVIAASLTRLGATKQAQREVADSILDLLSEPKPIDALLTGSFSPARRRLYILGIRLRDDVARRACTDLVKAAGDVGASEDDLFPAWQNAITEVSRISRGKR
ncbi:hypothetical protein [Phytohabitans aurantiacus]|uniref:Uncharacterized protein n=1 Tax=Phytohabitans aurantiacus TaxID=3016789 RepID=A0ABQ5R2J3_9ACTN|nr:hypothetical protein [Phytohabitans aurantiacus]GLH99810.1 hypothetical protein Pa4123_50870 [Phytohabitans aurantiacus]